MYMPDKKNVYCLFRAKNFRDARIAVFKAFIEGPDDHNLRVLAEGPKILTETLEMKTI